MEPFAIRLDPPRSGAENMQEDSSLLHLLQSAAGIHTVVRFYQWTCPTASIGTNQVAEKALDADYCAAMKIPIVRRPTGGRAVLHADELTYAFVSNHPLLLQSPGVARASQVIARGLHNGLCRLGLTSDRVEKRSVRTPTPNGTLKNPCFASTSLHELSVEQHKLVGSAQRRLTRSILQHGSIPLRIDYTAMSRVLGCTPQLLRDHMTSVSEALGRNVTFVELAGCLAKGMAWLFETELDGNLG